VCRLQVQQLAGNGLCMPAAASFLFFILSHLVRREVAEASIMNDSLSTGRQLRCAPTVIVDKASVGNDGSDSDGSDSSIVEASGACDGR
jgi:hypothetical protein